MPEPRRLAVIRGIAEAAKAWRDPDYPVRASAVEITLQAPNTFTQEALAFAVNQQMSVLTEGDLVTWAPDRAARMGLAIGVLNPGNVPFADLQDFIAVLLAGHNYLGRVSSRSPALLPAFASDVSSRVDDLSIEFDELDAVLERADAVVSTGSDETRDRIRERCDELGMPQQRRLLRGRRFSVAVLDGGESDQELEGLAEDALLHEGFGCRNVALIWAPDGLQPDRLLSAFAHFRAVFPPHSETPGRLKMPQAFLAAVGVPHAHGEGLEFLLSKGEPEPQQPGHVRWSVYSDVSQVDRWLAAHEGSLQLIVARDEIHDRLTVKMPVCAPGEAQRPPLDWHPDGHDVMQFLAELS